jgi:hypothetical protein
VTSRPVLFALAACGLAVPLVIQASCVAVFGVDVEKLRNAVQDMCACDQLKAVETCESTLSKRLDGAGEAARTAWLAKYDEQCTTCGGALTCLSAVPTCSLDKCKLSEECCQVSDAGEVKCVDGTCSK